MTGADPALSLRGITFDVSITDPKERIQAFIDGYRGDGIDSNVSRCMAAKCND